MSLAVSEGDMKKVAEELVGRPHINSSSLIAFPSTKTPLKLPNHFSHPHFLIEEKSSSSKDEQRLENGVEIG